MYGIAKSVCKIKKNMAKISLFLDTRRADARKEGSPRIRIQHNNTNADYFTGIYIARECWDAERQMVINNRLALDYNRTIFNLLDKWNSALLRIIDTVGLMCIGTARELKDEIIHIIYPRSAKDKKKVLFIKRYMAFMNRKSPGTRGIYAETLKKMQAFDPNLDTRGMEDITPQWLRDMNVALKKIGPYTRKGLGGKKSTTLLLRTYRNTGAVIPGPLLRHISIYLRKPLPRLWGMEGAV